MTSKAELPVAARALIQQEVRDGENILVAGLASLGKNPFPFWWPSKPNAVGISPDEVILIPIMMTRPLRKKLEAEASHYPLSDCTLVRDKSNFAYESLVVRFGENLLYFTIPKHSRALAEALRTLAPQA